MYGEQLPAGNHSARRQSTCAVCRMFQSFVGEESMGVFAWVFMTMFLVLLFDLLRREYA